MHNGPGRPPDQDALRGASDLGTSMRRIRVPAMMPLLWNLPVPVRREVIGRPGLEEPERRQTPGLSAAPSDSTRRSRAGTRWARRPRPNPPIRSRMACQSRKPPRRPACPSRQPPGGREPAPNHPDWRGALQLRAHGQHPGHAGVGRTAKRAYPTPFLCQQRRYLSGGSPGPPGDCPTVRQRTVEGACVVLLGAEWAPAHCFRQRCRLAILEAVSAGVEEWGLTSYRSCILSPLA